MVKLLKNLVRSESAQDLAEYGIALAVIGVAAITAAIAISGYVNTLWTNASIVIGGAV